MADPHGLSGQAASSADTQIPALPWNAQHGDVIARDLIDRSTAITENDLRREGFNHILHDLRETLDRHAA